MCWPSGTLWTTLLFTGTHRCARRDVRKEHRSIPHISGRGTQVKSRSEVKKKNHLVPQIGELSLLLRAKKNFFWCKLTCIKNIFYYVPCTAQEVLSVSFRLISWQLYVRDTRVNNIPDGQTWKRRCRGVQFKASVHLEGLEVGVGDNSWPWTIQALALWRMPDDADCHGQELASDLLTLKRKYSVMVQGHVVHRAIEPHTRTAAVTHDEVVVPPWQSFCAHWKRRRAMRMD